MAWKSPQCSVCCSRTFTHKAHIKARRSFEKDENDRIFNILPICPRCHNIFDSPNCGFTLHHEWKCWIFSDVKSFGVEGNEFDNPFYDFHYSYPPPIHARKISRIDRGKIIENQEKEFNNRYGVPSRVFFERLETKLRGKGLWDEETGAPVVRRIRERMDLV